MDEKLESLIEVIREEERAKIMKELKVKFTRQRPWHKVSNYIESWGEANSIEPRDLYKIKSSVYTIVRYSMDINRMENLKEEDTDMAIRAAGIILRMIA